MEIINPILANALDLLKQGNTEKSEREFAKAAKECCAAFGETDIVTVRTLAHLARVCTSRGKVDIAVPMYERIISIHEVLPEPSNSDHAVALLELAGLQESSGLHEEASVLRCRADDIMAKLKVQIHAATAKKDLVESSGEDDDGNSDDDDDEDDNKCQDSIDRDGSRGSPNNDRGGDERGDISMQNQADV